ncbi:MAG TPA: serine/threonine-protein kinase [Labilithrix sp.]|nr:serine/threonine-protein kinase [Labilithrix sp.]
MAHPKSKSGDDGGPNARLGTVIKGKWKIDALLGVGGMAAVYAASHRNGQRAALKIHHTDFAREKVICERFLREAYVSNKVNHGATVQVLDDDVTEQGEPFLIMELLEGETVRDAWKKSGRTMPAGRVLQICEPVLDCLASCHAIKVIHRDLKPANIFILRDADEIRVLDFGVAQMRDATSERTATGTALGTPAYMSPEQAMGLVDQLDGRADLFSVGAMMHALITGHRINNGRTEQEALVMAATKPVPSVARLAPHLPIELIRVIDKSLAWDRRNRFQDAREMQKALLELMPSLGVSPLPGRPPPRPHEVVAPPPPQVSVTFPAQQPPPLPTGHVAPPPAASPSRPASAMKSSGVSILSGSAASPMRGQPQPAFDPLLGGFAPPVAVPPAQSSSQSIEVHESDSRVVALRDLMKHFDRLFPSVRQFGWAHPATERSLQIAYDACVEALKQQPTVVRWTLRPYSFMTLGHTVWEPGAPFDAIPYNLFACGIRELSIEPGITLEELRALFELWLLDPGRDLPPEDDLAAALWERGLVHVKWECADAFADGDASEREAFYGEADEVEHLAEAATANQLNRLEVRAMALSTDDAALGKKKVLSPFSLDEATQRHLAPHFELPREAWAERIVDALVEGYLDAASNRDAPLVLASLRRSAADLVVAGRIDVAVNIHLAVVERLRARVQGPENQSKLVAALTNAMFGGETLEIALKRLLEDPSGVEAFAMVLPGLTSNEFGAVLSALREVVHPDVRALLVPFVERWAAGRESELGKAAVGAEPEIASYIVQLLGRMGTPAARQVLAQLAQNNDDPNVRVEARVLVAPSAEHAQNELSALLDNATALVRLAALRASTRYGMRNVWPTVARLIGAKNFNDFGADERRELFRTCVLLSPERGEPLLVDFAKKGGVLSSGERETSRAMAAELLGELSRSRATASALQEIANARWGVSEEVRAAATNAAKRIGLRLAQPQGSVNA